MKEINVVSYPVEIGLRVIGVWPGTPNPILCRVLWTTLMMSTQSLQYWHVVSHIGTNDMPGLLESCALTITYTIVLSRMVLLWMNERTVVNVINTMAEDWRHSLSVKWQMEMLATKAKLSTRVVKWIVIVYAMSAFIFNAPLMLMVMLKPYNSDSDGDKLLLLKTMFPIDCGISVVREILLFEQFLHQSAGVVVAGVSTGLLITCVLHVDGQIDIIRQSLSEITSNVHFDSTIAHLRYLVRKHQKLIATSDDIETIFTYMAFLTFLTIALLFGCVGFIIFVSIDDVLTQIIFLIYYVCTIADVFIYCSIGEYLREKSVSIGHAVYDSLWYELKPNECQILMVLMLRSQKWLTITAGKFFDVTLEVFATIIKTSVSYVSLFYALY